MTFNNIKFTISITCCLHIFPPHQVHTHTSPATWWKKPVRVVWYAPCLFPCYMQTEAACILVWRAHSSYLPWGASGKLKQLFSLHHGFGIERERESSQNPFSAHGWCLSCLSWPTCFHILHTERMLVTSHAESRTHGKWSSSCLPPPHVHSSRHSPPAQRRLECKAVPKMQYLPGYLSQLTSLVFSES